MKYLTVLLILFSFFSAAGQNYITIHGEFMDTASTANLKCSSDSLYYYEIGGKYPRSSSTLLKESQAFIEKKNNKYSGSGYITFRFMIDCEGKMLKRVQVLQTDTDYKKYHFDKIFVNDLFDYLKTLDQWKIAKSQSGKTFNYLAFITFKISNGKVINIIP
jgi:hypothetical protein